MKLGISHTFIDLQRASVRIFDTAPALVDPILCDLVASFPDLATTIALAVPYEAAAVHPYVAWAFQQDDVGRWVARLWPTMRDQAPFYCVFTRGCWSTNHLDEYDVYRSLDDIPEAS